MSTKCKWINGVQTFYNTPMMVAGGTISANAVFASDTEAVIFTTTIPVNTFNDTNMHFKITMAGLISSDGSDDITLDLKFGSTTIATITTTSLPNEDDKAFWLEFVGRIHTTGATGKVVANGRFMNAATGMADIIVGTAAAGVTTDFTAVTSINVTADWDDTNADTDITLTSAILELYNQ